MKIVLFVCFYTLSFLLIGQENPYKWNIQTGVLFNDSNDEFNNPSALGILIEGNYFFTEKTRFGVRVEPTALVYGLAVYPGGCEEEHKRYPGMPSCREGANFLTNSYLKVDYMLGRNKMNKKGLRKHWYVGANLVILAHNRYVITSRAAGNWKDTRQFITDFGFGPRLGWLSGVFDISASYIITGDQFQNYFGFNFGVLVWKK